MNKSTKIDIKKWYTASKMVITHIRKTNYFGVRSKFTKKANCELQSKCLRFYESVCFVEWDDQMRECLALESDKMKRKPPRRADKELI